MNSKGFLLIECMFSLLLFGALLLTTNHILIQENSQLKTLNSLNKLNSSFSIIREITQSAVTDGASEVNFKLHELMLDVKANCQPIKCEAQQAISSTASCLLLVNDLENKKVFSYGPLYFTEK